MFSFFVSLEPKVLPLEKTNTPDRASPRLQVTQVNEEHLKEIFGNYGKVRRFCFGLVRMIRVLKHQEWCFLVFVIWSQKGPSLLSHQ